MKIEILQRPAFAAAVIKLEKDEAVITDTNSMISMTANIEMNTEIRGGIVKGLAKILMGNHSIFNNRYVSKDGEGELMVAHRLPGDVEVLEIENPIYLKSGAFLACSSDISLDTAWGGAQTFFSDEGQFLLKTSGKGKLIAGGYGGIIKKVLSEGEKYLADTGHIIGFTEQIKYQVKPVGKLKQMLLSGEILAVELEGPGEVYIQTRNEDDLLTWLAAQVNRKNFRHKRDK